MNLHYRKSSAIVVVLVLMAVAVMIPLGANAGDQAHSMADFFSNPPSVQFVSVAWNEHTYFYAIAVGVNTSTGNGVIYRYTPDGGWTNIYSSPNDTYYDVIYGQENRDTFYIGGVHDGSSLVLRLDNAYVAPSTSIIGPSPGDVIYGISMDRNRGNDGYLVCAGVGKDGSGNSGGMIMVHNLSEPDSSWTSHYTVADHVLRDITFNGGSKYPLFIAVGYNSSSSHGVVYAYNYSNLWPIDVPDDCSSLYSVSWYKANPDAYALAVGEDTSGNGVAYRINVNFPGPRLAYTYTKDPYSLRYAYGSNEVHTSTPVGLTHANFTSIATTHNGDPRIAYYNNQNHELMYAYYKDRVWRSIPVDTVGDVGMYCSLALDYASRPYISYYDHTNGYLKIAWYDNGWNTGVIDSSGTAGKYTDMVIDKQGHFHISYVDTSAGLKYAYYDGTQWSTQVVDSQGKGATSIAVDSLNRPHIAYVDGSNVKYIYFNGTAWSDDGAGSAGFSTPGSVTPHLVLNNTGAPYIIIFSDREYITDKHKQGSGWALDDLHISSSSSRYADDGAVVVEPNDDIEVFYSYVDTSISSVPYSLNYTKIDAGTGSWHTPTVLDSPYMGGSPSAVFFNGIHASMEELSPVDTSVSIGPLYGVDWSADGSQATLVGASGEIYLYYDGKSTISLWNDNGPGDLQAVAVKPPGSPSYALAVGTSSSAIASTQVADKSTTISAGVHTPHINSLDFLDAYGVSRLNQQVDVGANYTFRMNTSYAEGWEKIGINITAWYDFYDGTSEKNYNETPERNYNFRLHFEPDPVDPYNRSGNCTLLWPKTGEVTLDSWHIDVVDNPSDGTLGVNDGKDYYIISIVLNFGQQMAYAPGDGTWNAAGDQSDSAIAFNDHYSWNFNMTIYDRTAPSSRESKYDEFGIYAYTEISAQGSPTGSGIPGSLIYLSPSSNIYIRTNVRYNVTVNITDLKNKTGGAYIPREDVEVLNYNPAGDNSTSNTDLHNWTAFPTAPDPLFVWGTSAGSHMNPLGSGTYTAGYQAGYSSSPVYTTIMWRIHLPTVREDTFTATIVYSIDYSV